MSNQHELPLASKAKLVGALLDCDCMKDAASRNQVVNQLPPQIWQRINRFQNDRQDVMSIVNTCLQFDGGLEKLFELIEFFEGDSRGWQQLRRVSEEVNHARPARPGAVAAVPAVGRGDAAVAPALAPGKRYHVFLSHNSLDKAFVERLAARLMDEGGLKPFLDKWHLVPGDPWQEALEEALDASAACAVFLGPNGLSPWENEEMRSALDERTRDRTLRVIPVLLPGADPKDPNTLPRFLRRPTWVDFRAGVEDRGAFRRLLAGVEGREPGRDDA